MIAKNLFTNLLACMMITQLVGCQDDDKEEKPKRHEVYIGSYVDDDRLVNFEVGDGNIRLFMPRYLMNGWPLPLKEPYSYVYTRGLEKEQIEVPGDISTEISFKACDPVQQAKEFLDEEQILVSQGTETLLVREWSGESDTFKGKSLLRTQYDEGELTKSYRLAILLANEKAAECVYWNVTITPATPLAVSFVEGSTEFARLLKGLEKTWRGIGADFHAE